MTLATAEQLRAENQKRARILLTWQQLQATSGDIGWVRIINKADRLCLDLDFPTAEVALPNPTSAGANPNLIRPFAIK